MTTEKTAAAPRCTEEQLVLQSVRLRLIAIYHSCRSSAAFTREEAVRCGDEHVADACRREARGYEVAAGWIDEAIRSMQNPNNHPPAECG